MKTLKQIKKIIIAVVGFTILVLGLLMIVLPGPAFIFIPLGLTILASEFVWAEMWLKKVKSKFKEANDKLKGKKAA